MKPISGVRVVNDNAVALWIIRPKGSKTDEYYIVREFDTNDEMEDFYDNVEIGKDRFAMNRIKIALCSHKETKDIISLDKRDKFEVCVNCNHGVYKSLLTKEEEELSQISTQIKFSKFEIDNLKESITSMEKEIKHAKDKIIIENDNLESLKKLHAKMEDEIKSD